MLQYIDEVEITPVPQQRTGRFFPLLANATFILYLFFTFFGTALPFREKVSEISDIATSNIVNQIVFTILFLFSVAALLPQIKTAAAILFREKIFTFFLIWALLSIIWSDYSFVSFKRWFQYFTGFTVGLSVMVHTDFSETLLKRIKYLFYLYVLVSFATIFTIPGATDSYGIWRGIAPSKNHLGQAALISTLVIFYSVWIEKGFKRIVPAVMLIMAAGLLAGSQSMTSITTLIVLFFLGTIFYFDNYFRSLNIGRFVSIILIVLVSALFLTVVFYAPDLLESAASSAGRDLTFTGRTELWSDILRETENHWLMGAGFQGFWVVENPHLLALYDIYVWLPNQAHNGYVDIVNELGVIGLFLFILILINYFRQSVKLKLPHYWKWFVIAAVIINFQETTFIRPQIATGVMFVFSYLALFSDVYRKEKYSFDEDNDELVQREF